jgi:peptide-methionine (S)-S-oxide reductase
MMRVRVELVNDTTRRARRWVASRYYFDSITAQTITSDTTISDMATSDLGTARREVATLAGGCFWCLDAVFRLLRGVEKVESGYAGGHTPNPSYHDVCSGATGHAEVVQITFDPSVISYRDLLGVFFTSHDPTTLNRQGADVGTQYRSAIFYHDAAQRMTAEQVMAELTRERTWNAPIVTEVAPFEGFFPAEGYHQDYYANNSRQPYCQIVVAPKVAKVRKKYLDRLAVSP